MSTRPTPAESDYPGTVFFGVHRGHKTGVRATFAQLMKEIDNFKSPIWEAFNNKAHAEQFAKNGRVPSGVTPVQPGAHNTPTSKRTPGQPGSSGGGRFAAPMNRVSSTAPSSSSALGVTKSMSALANATAPGLKLSAMKSVPPFNSSPTRAGRPTTGPVTQPSRSASTISGSTRGQPVSATTSASSIASRSMSGATSASTANTDLGGEETIEVWTDGSCLNNGKENARAAYGVYFGDGNSRNEAGRVPGLQTNNRGEILGVIRALEIVGADVPNLIVYTDSQYTINSCTKWLPSWVKRGGRNASNKPVANYSMIRYLDALAQRLGSRLQLLYVKGHSTNAGNNAADELANQAAAAIFQVPDEVDWDKKRYDLERQPSPPPIGRPVIKEVPAEAVSSTPPRTQVTKGSIARALENAKMAITVPDSEDEYDEYNDDDFLDIDESSLPQPLVPPPTAVSQITQGKRARETAGGEEEIEDSETERKAVKKAGKKRRVKCPECKHEFGI